MLNIRELLSKAFDMRQPLFDAERLSAFRLFNGFSEGCPELVIDLYGSTLLLIHYPASPEGGRALVEGALDFAHKTLPWLGAGILKTRNSSSPIERRGVPLFGAQPDRKIQEAGVWYALDLTLNQDAGFYLDTRGLRQWCKDHLQGRTVLNTFAYTGSLGVAALAGGAQRVVQLDRSRSSLNLARQSYELNDLPLAENDLLCADFFVQVARLKRSGTRFDCVLIDPPFFAASSTGRIDQVNHSARLINKVRPLIADGGYLVAVNNALFVSGKEYLQTLEELCADGYMKIMDLISVPEDITGYPGTRLAAPVTDPAPFNHSTKIAVLSVRRK